MLAGDRCDELKNLLKIGLQNVHKHEGKKQRSQVQCQIGGCDKKRTAGRTE
jgi:hypothetical protein